MIHINPFDTGFDENSHVMKFSAVARDIITTTHAPPKFVVRRPELPSTQAPTLGDAPLAAPASARLPIPKELLAAAMAARLQSKSIVPTVEVTGEEGLPAAEEAEVAGDLAAAASPRNSEVEREVVEEVLTVAVEGEPCSLSVRHGRTSTRRGTDFVSICVFSLSQRRKTTTTTSRTLWLSTSSTSSRS